MNMKAIILAAGYGTRLEKGLNELKVKNPAKYNRIKHAVEGKSKPLIALAGKPLIEYTVENIVRAGIQEVYVITNHTFFKAFNEWKQDYKGKALIKIINDNTESNDKRLGAVGNLQFLLEQEDIKDDSLIIGGDNLIIFELKELAEFYKNKHTNILVAYNETDTGRIKRANRVEFDTKDYVSLFEEKPDDPRDREWVCPPFYIYTAETIKIIREMKIPDEKKDYMGNIPMMLYKQIPFHVLLKKEKIRFDLGSIDDFEKAEEYAKSLETK